MSSKPQFWREDDGRRPVPGVSILNSSARGQFNDSLDTRGRSRSELGHQPWYVPVGAEFDSEMLGGYRNDVDERLFRHTDNPWSSYYEDRIKEALADGHYTAELLEYDEADFDLLDHAPMRPKRGQNSDGVLDADYGVETENDLEWFLEHLPSCLTAEEERRQALLMIQAKQQAKMSKADIKRYQRRIKEIDRQINEEWDYLDDDSKEKA